MSVLRYLAPEGWAEVTSDGDPERAGERIRWIAEAQDGPVSRRQLLGCGFSNGGVSRLVACEWLLRLYPGVYVLGHRALTQRGKLVAAVLHAGEGSAISHGTAAVLRDLIARELFPVHISSENKRRPLAGIAFHRPKSFEFDIHRGVPVTTIAQTLVDVAPSCSDWELRKALAQADFRGTLSADAIGRVTGKGHPGSKPLRAAIRGHMPELAQTLSPLEDLLLLLCERHGLRLPEPNARVGKFKPDGVWPASMLIVELDGGPNHSSPSQRRRDAERDMYFRSRGYLVLRYTYWQIRRAEDEIAAELGATLEARSTLLG